MKAIFFILLSNLTLPFFGQQELILNNNIYLVINNGQVVIENANSNAIKVLGSGGNIISEDETNILNWKVGEETGVFIVPFTSHNLIKIPLSLEITESGQAGDGIEFSTYATDNEENTPYPFEVPPLLNCFKEANSLAVVDRFWNINAVGYLSKPKVELSITYDEVYEVGGLNELSEANLKAMYYNIDTEKWESKSSFLGVVDENNNKVDDIRVAANDFYKSWILVDSASLFSELCTNQLVIPEAFTPNGDDINDTFQILGLYNYSANSITVFNRWGSRVFSSENYDSSWGGEAEGSDLLPSGVYFYILELTTESQTQEIKKGSIYIQR